MPSNPEPNQDTRAPGSPTTPPPSDLPKGGGAIRGMGEKFAANPVTGTGSMTVPIATSPGRAGFGPQLALSYDSGAGNGPFGFGWSLSLPSITRKTDKGLPQYRMPRSPMSSSSPAPKTWCRFSSKTPRAMGMRETSCTPRTVDGVTYRIRRYRPRIEGLFARIERWTNGPIRRRALALDLQGQHHSPSTARTTTHASPIPTDPQRIFSWLICETRDDKGNAVLYEYKAEDSQGIDLSQAHERNRTAQRPLGQPLSEAHPLRQSHPPPRRARTPTPPS